MNFYRNKEKKSLCKIKEKNLKDEIKFLNQQDNEYIKSKIQPIKETIESKIPKKMTETLKTAFEKGFYFVFEKGTLIIEKSYNSEKIKEESEINEYIFNKRKNKKNLKRFDKSVNKSAILNSGITGVEGFALGFLGIGLPDIPVFISVILKNIYEISLKYGFDYKNEKEKIFILNLITLSVCNSEERELYSKKLDKIGENIDNGIPLTLDFDSEIKVASDHLVEKMLVSKFIQGIPLVGALGGITNIKLLNRISNAAKIKYKKRMINNI